MQCLTFQDVLTLLCSNVRVQSKSASVKDDLMNRLSNAIKQRDAAREEALLAAEKLNKLQEDLDNGVLQGAPQNLGSASPSQSLSTPPPFPGGTEPGEHLSECSQGLQ